jgi:hypothetical protein
MDAPDFDFTRVQHRACPVCEDDPKAVPDADLGPAVMEAARRWSAFLSTVADHPGGPDALRVRPLADVWSAIEYGCHVRDGLALACRNIEVATLVHVPDLRAWDHEAAVCDDHYSEQEPGAVGADIVVGARHLAELIQALPAAALGRGALRGRTEFTIAGLARYALHEQHHHLGDARSVVPSPTTSAG